MTDLEKAARQALEALEEGYQTHTPEFKNAITALREALAEQPAQADGDTIVQTFTGLPKRKLRELLSGGWEVNGVCFQRIETDGTVRRGAATTGGMVLWWNAEQPAQQEPVAHSIVAGALFDFMGWLTSRKERLVLSSVNDASPAVEVIKQFAEMRCLSLDEANVKEWQEHLYTRPQAREPLTDEQREEIAKGWRGRNWTVGDIIDATEAAHGITGEKK